MKNFIPFFIIWLFASSTTLSQDKPEINNGVNRAANQRQAEKDVEAIRVLHKALAAHGGSLSVIPSSIIASGTYTIFSETNPTPHTFRLRVLGSDRVRREVDFADGTYARVVRGRAGWSVTPSGSTPIPLGQLAGSSFEDQPVIALAQWIASPSKEVRHLAKEILAEKPVTHLVAKEHKDELAPELRHTYEEATACELFIDATTNVVQRLRYYDHPRDWRVGIPVDLDFSDFRPVSGFLLPFKVTRSVQGQLQSETTYTSIEVNVPLTDSEFFAR